MVKLYTMAASTDMPNLSYEKQARGNSQHYEDIALNFTLENEPVTLTPEDDRQCLRRVDMVMMPLMFLSFGLQYMDKACLTGAALFGIIEDLNLFDIVEINNKPALSLQKYTYCSLIFFWGYLLGGSSHLYTCSISIMACYLSALHMLT